MVGKRINNLPSVDAYSDNDYIIVEQELGTRKGTFKQITDTIVQKLSNDKDLSSNLITASGALSALGNEGGKAMSGKFHVDTGFAITAPSYDSDNNIETSQHVITINYNYNSGSSAARYPSVFSIGNTSIDLNLYGKNIISLGEAYHTGNIEVNGDLYLSNPYKKIYTKTPNGNKVCLLQTAMNGVIQELQFGDHLSQLCITGKGDPTYADSDKMTVYNLLHNGNIINYPIEGITLRTNAESGIYTSNNLGEKTPIISYNGITKKITIGNENTEVDIFGWNNDTINTDDFLTEEKLQDDTKGVYINKLYAGELNIGREMALEAIRSIYHGPGGVHDLIFGSTYYNNYIASQNDIYRLPSFGGSISSSDTKYKMLDEDNIANTTLTGIKLEYNSAIHSNYTPAPNTNFDVRLIRLENGIVVLGDDEHGKQAAINNCRILTEGYGDVSHFFGTCNSSLGFMHFVSTPSESVYEEVEETFFCSYTGGYKVSISCTITGGGPVEIKFGPEDGSNLETILEYSLSNASSTDKMTVSAFTDIRMEKPKKYKLFKTGSSTLSNIRVEIKLIGTSTSATEI